jgi:cytochrome b involved in lipid metabolism
MDKEPFTNRELKKYFDDFKEDLRQITSTIEINQNNNNERFLKLERDIIELKLKDESFAVKIAGAVFIVSAFVSAVIVGLSNKLFS